MKNINIFELKLNQKESLIAYEKKNYDTCYEDSVLYIQTGSKRKKLIESSFCYGFGAEMYYRVHNMYDYVSVEDYVKQLKYFLDNQTYDEVEVDYNNPLNNSYFVSCSVLANFDLYLVKINGEHTLLFIKTSEVEPRKYIVEVVKEFIISEKDFAEWKSVICNEWEKRAVVEGEKIAEANSRPKSTKEEWEQYFLMMRSDKSK